MSEQLYRWVKASEENPKQCGNYEIIGVNNQGNPTPPHGIWFTGTRWAAREGCEVVFWKLVSPSPVSGSLEDAAKNYANAEATPIIRSMYMASRTEYAEKLKAAYLAGALHVNDYKEVIEDHKRLVRELDEIINGKEGMAKQASLCDIVAQLKKEYSTLTAPSDEIEGSISEMEDDRILADVEKIRKESGVYIWAFPITYRDENGKGEKITFGWEIEWPSGQTNGYNQERETYFKALNEGIKAYQ